MPKDELRASSLSGDRYSLLISKLWCPAFRKLQGTVILRIYFSYCFCSDNILFLPWNEICKIEKGSSGEELSKHTLLYFSYFQTPSDIYITSKEAKTGNWAERRAGNSKYIESSEMQKFILTFNHILVLQEDQTLWQKLNGLCQTDWRCIGSVKKPGLTLALFSDQSEP